MTTTLTRPPPTYNEAGALPLAAHTTNIDLSTLDGKISVSQAYEVQQIPGPRLEDRRIVLRDRVSGSEDFVVTLEAFAPAEEIRKMILHRNTSDGQIEAEASISSTEGTLGIIACAGSKTKITEHKKKLGVVTPPSTTKPANGAKHFFQVGDLTWSVSRRYLHPTKGKSRAGDLEFIDQDGNVLAIFLNQWSGSPRADALGSLYLSPAMSLLATPNAIPLIVLSALLVVTHLSYRDRDGAKEFVKDVAGGAALCIVM